MLHCWNKRNKNSVSDTEFISANSIKFSSHLTYSGSKIYIQYNCDIPLFNHTTGLASALVSSIAPLESYQQPLSTEDSVVQLKASKSGPCCVFM